MRLTSHKKTHSRKASPIRSLALAVLATSLGHGTALAQSDEKQQWYQVELIFFSQSLTDTDAQESWPTDIALAYPLGTVQLAPPQTTKENSVVDGFLADGPGSQAERTNTLDTSSELVTAPPIEPFTQVPDTEYSLTAVKNTLQRNSKFRVLRHLAWRQPIFASDSTKSVVMTGGEKFGEHYELEGTVALRASRYMHLQTNLWMTQFYPNYGQQSGYTKWPSLPAVPGSEIEETTAGAVDDLDYSTQWIDAAKDTANFGLSGEFDPISESNRPSYIIDNIIYNQQSRKLRTDEIHYLDHPALGIIAKVTTWDPTPKPEVETQQPELTP